MSSKEDDKKESRPEPWKPKEALSLFETLKPYADKLLQYFKEQAESEHRLAELAARQDWRIATVALVFLGVIVGAMSTLTFYSKVSGDALLFLVGTVTGYIFSLIFKLRVRPTSRDEEEE